VILARLLALERAAAEKDGGGKLRVGAMRLGYGQQLQQLEKTS
jgi:hypothetical protein